MADDQLTHGEIGRALERVEAAIVSHGVKLDAIIVQTTKTNGTVARHDERLTVNDREIRALKDDHRRVVWAVFGLIASVIAGVVVAWVSKT